MCRGIKISLGCEEVTQLFDFFNLQASNLLKVTVHMTSPTFLDHSLGVNVDQSVFNMIQVSYLLDFGMTFCNKILWFLKCFYWILSRTEIEFCMRGFSCSGCEVLSCGWNC